MERCAWIDWLRTTAIFFVIIVHCTEPFYLGGEGSLIASESDAFWVSLFDSFARACVPLFIIASSYLQFPLHRPASQFLKKRVVRVLIPFAVWTAVYALAFGEPIQNFKDLLLNFNYAAGHLWFVYMLVGIYLLIPMLSPWAERVSRRELGFYLAICLFTTLIPFIREMAGADSAAVIYGPSGIPNYAKFPLWGECSWNQYGTFYYLSGFIGYLLFGLYVRRFLGDFSKQASMAVGFLALICGFAICFFGFLYRVYDTAAATGFPVEGPVGIAALWETPWFNDTTGTALMAIGWVFLFKNIKSEGPAYRWVTLPLAKASYGVYLLHMLILVEVFGWISNVVGHAGISAVWATPIIIATSAIITFILSSAASMLLGRIPRLGKYLVG